ncbi:MAG: hypothetical protein ISS78_10405 [Phycisphaerae bacterium]|nr:hypothetical protein [Phycisphaerae bacterium]
MRRQRNREWSRESLQTLCGLLSSVFAQKHGLDPLDAIRDFLDVALICRGTAVAVCEAARYN